MSSTEERMGVIHSKNDFLIFTRKTYNAEVRDGTDWDGERLKRLADQYALIPREDGKEAPRKFVYEKSLTL